MDDFVAGLRDELEIADNADLVPYRWFNEEDWDAFRCRELHGCHNKRLLEPIGYISPAAFENRYNQQRHTAVVNAALA